ncbi:MAG: nucleotide modification associated domain-containing protein [Armatimonadota bacterium]|nr:nucleotide modification associated domain-containing protein [Armatimonadota bacterium]
MTGTHWFEAVERGLKALAGDLMARKRRDYSPGADPFRNFRQAELLGVPAWRGALVRLTDKISRMASLAEKGGVGEVQDESLVDTAVDAINYVILAFCLILETMPGEQQERMVRQLDAAARGS